MKLLKVLILLTIVVVVCVAQNVSQFQKPKEPVDATIRFSPATKSPELALSISLNAEMKIVSRKTIGRIGEMMFLDIALMSTSKKSSLFPSISTVNLSVQDSRGRNLTVRKYSVMDSIGPFNLLAPERMHSQSLAILIGCDDSVFETVYLRKHAKDDFTVFEKNLFVSPGDACLEVRSGTFVYITATLENHSVVISPSFRGVQTAVGVLHSNGIKLEVK